MTTPNEMPRDALEQLSDRAQVLTAGLEHITSLTISVSDGKYHVHPNVSPRIKNPVRIHELQRNALRKLGKIATAEDIETNICQNGNTLTAKLSLSFANANDLNIVVTTGYDRLSEPEARINTNATENARA